MSLSQSLLPEFDQEMANTRRVLERVADQHLDWAPHPKSFSMGKLATHVATLPGWGTMTLGQDTFDLAPVDGEAWKQPALSSRDEMLAAFDATTAEARRSIAAATDEAMMSNWSLLQAGQTIFTLPKVAVLRSFVMNHIIHHRAQLTVYLRLKDIPVPGLYGPSADEAM